MLIVISGRPGSGKSSLASYLSKKYNLRLVSAGNMFREVAKEQGFEPRGSSFLDFHKELEKDRKLSEKIDKQVDMKVVSEAKKGNCVIEGWLAGYFVKKADLKIFLNVPLKVAAKRIANRENVKDNLHITIKRERSFLRRARKEYNIDPNDVSYYDFVVNTAKLSQEDTERIVDIMVDAI
jgi:cytidylate kinase